VTIQPNGQIVVAGGQFSEFYVARYNPADGSLDSSFGNNGIAVTAGVSVAANEHVDVALEPDGRIVVAGSTVNSAGNANFVLARFLATGPQIGSFTASPNPVPSGSSLTLTASSLTDSNPSSSITQVAFYLDSNGDGTLEPQTDQPLGYATQSSPGVWSFTFTVNLAPGSYTLFTQAEDSDGAVGDATALTLTVQ
jgi:uncharacterized delta-60 repeat protein